MNSKLSGRILIVDDESGIRDIIKQYLEFEGYAYDEAINGNQAVDLAIKNSYDLIIMDVMMPLLDGISALRIIREKSEVPVIMLTAKAEEYDKVFGFSLGADDYIVKPFSPRELMLRISAVLKRTKKINKTSEIHTYKNLIVNQTSHEVKINNEIMPLTPKEFDMLVYFINNNGNVATRDELLHSIWGFDFYGDSRTVDTHVKMLRNNLKEYRELIKTVWGVGYRYDEN